MEFSRQHDQMQADQPFRIFADAGTYSPQAGFSIDLRPKILSYITPHDTLYPLSFF